MCECDSYVFGFLAMFYTSIELKANIQIDIHGLENC